MLQVSTESSGLSKVLDVSLLLVTYNGKLWTWSGCVREFENGKHHIIPFQRSNS